MSTPRNNGYGRADSYGEGYTADQTRQFDARDLNRGSEQYGEHDPYGYGSQRNSGYAGTGYVQPAQPQSGYGQQGYSQQGAYQSGQNWSDAGQSARTPGLIAGRFVAKRVVLNLVILGILSAAVTFAAVYIIDLLISQFAGVSSGGVGTAVIIGVLAGFVGVFAGLLYIPVVGTGNEHLFGLAVIALALVAAVVWVLLGGLLDGDWRTLVTLAGIIAAAMTAWATRPRIEAADVHRVTNPYGAR